MKEKCSSCETLHVKYNSNTSPHLSGIPGFNLLSLQKKKRLDVSLKIMMNYLLLFFLMSCSQTYIYEVLCSL